MIDDPAAYFWKFGEFHDGCLKSFRWDCDGWVIETAIDDYRAAIDEDNVPDDAQGSLTFRGAANLSGPFDDSNLRISALSVARNEANWRAKLILKSGATLGWSFESVAEAEQRT